MRKTFALIAIMIISICGRAQEDLLAHRKLSPVKAHARKVMLDGKQVLRVTMDTAEKQFDEATFIKLDGVEFQDGTIDVNLMSRFLPDAPDYARGFIGVAFRINTDNSKFESVYLRPNNGRADDQIRRNHTTQYFSYPDHKFDTLRITDPGKYESYVDIGMNEWIRMKLVVKGQNARLFVNDSEQPCLIVNDLKHGVDMKGSIALWVGEGTEGFFKDLKIEK